MTKFIALTPHLLTSFRRNLLPGAILPGAILAGAILATVALAAFPLVSRAQTHAVAAPQTVVRAIAVYEWTGDQAKPSASRIIPVSIFVDGRLRDAGIYLARPVPLALDTGTIFEVEDAGEHQGTLELAFARSLTTTGDQGNDNSWFGYGFFKPAPKETPVAKAKSTGPLPQIVVSGGKGPHFNSADKPDSSAGKPAATSEQTANPSQPEPARPQPVDRSGAASGTVSTDPADKPDIDPDSAEGNPDRPTLRRRTPQQKKEAQKKSQQAAVIGVGSLNDDPDRPILHRGREKSPEEELTPLLGLPAGMHHAVAVSDAKDRPQHDFHRAWESDAERAQVLSQMQTFARIRLADYAAHLLPATIAPLAAPSSKTSATTRSTAAPTRHAAAPAKKTTPHSSTHRAAHKQPQTPAPATPLTQESLAAFTLSYGGDPAFVYTASSPGAAGITRFVTIVAQRQPTGELKVALTSATDSAHLDRTANMLLVDAVDASASNRASLLFDLRAQNTRQFALYRVLGAQAEQTFATDNIPTGAPTRGSTLLRH